MKLDRACRKLRIAWSVGWGVVAVLLCVLWVRSHFDRTTFDILVTPTYRCYLHSLDGTVAVERVVRVFAGKELYVIYTPANRLRLRTNAGIRIHRDGSGGGIHGISITYWLVVAVSVFVGVIPWRRPRFSLRTPLIPTTLIAVLLGLLLWPSR